MGDKLLDTEKVIFVNDRVVRNATFSLSLPNGRTNEKVWKKKSESRQYLSLVYPGFCVSLSVRSINSGNLFSWSKLRGSKGRKFGCVMFHEWKTRRVAKKLALTWRIWHLGVSHLASSSQGRYIPRVTQLINITKILILSNHVHRS